MRWNLWTVKCRVVPLKALVVAPRAVPSAGVLAALGLETTEHPMEAGTFIAAGPMGETAAPGVWVAGNVADLGAQVIGAAATGAKAGAAINADLVTEDVQRAVAARRLSAPA